MAVSNGSVSYGKRLHTLTIISGGVTALLIAVETLLCALSFFGVLHPESALGAVKTHVLESGGYKISAFILAALTVFLLWRYTRTDAERSSVRYALITLCVRTAAVAVTEAAFFAMRLLGVDGGVNTLVSPDGYLIRMVEPLLSVISGTVVAVFSVAYLCAFFASVGDGIRSEDQRED